MDERKKKLLIFFKTGGVVQIEELPEGFDFARLCESVRSVGYLMNGLLYVPHDVINGMAYVLSENDIQWAPNDGKRSTLQ